MGGANVCRQPRREGSLQQRSPCRPGEGNPSSEGLPHVAQWPGCCASRGPAHDVLALPHSPHRAPLLGVQGWFQERKACVRGPLFLMRSCSLQRLSGFGATPSPLPCAPPMRGGVDRGSRRRRRPSLAQSSPLPSANRVSCRGGYRRQQGLWGTHMYLLGRSEHQRGHADGGQV